MSALTAAYSFDGSSVATSNTTVASQKNILGDFASYMTNVTTQKQTNISMLSPVAGEQVDCSVTQETCTTTQTLSPVYYNLGVSDVYGNTYKVKVFPGDDNNWEVDVLAYPGNNAQHPPQGIVSVTSTGPGSGYISIDANVFLDGDDPKDMPPLKVYWDNGKITGTNQLPLDRYVQWGGEYGDPHTPQQSGIPYATWQVNTAHPLTQSVTSTTWTSTNIDATLSTHASRILAAGLQQASTGLGTSVASDIIGLLLEQSQG